MEIYYIAIISSVEKCHGIRCHPTVVPHNGTLCRWVLCMYARREHMCISLYYHRVKCSVFQH